MSVATMDNVCRGNVKDSFQPAEVDPTAHLIEPLKVLEIAQDAGRSDYSAVEKNDKGLEVQEDAINPSATASTSVHVREWKAGSPCRAVFSEDGLVYPAVVMWVEGQRCRVRYDVYNNEEEVDMGSLLQPDELPGSNRAVKPASQGPIFRSTDWRRKRREENQSGGGERASPVEPLTFTPPPPFGGEDPGSDAVSSMMMMWYMCGFHTGTFMAQQRYKSSCSD
ncbi:uncharacterized protein ACB058_002490 isoform 9-T9 [Synchiropus picturatus]